MLGLVFIVFISNTVQLSVFLTQLSPQQKLGRDCSWIISGVSKCWSWKLKEKVLRILLSMVVNSNSKQLVNSSEQLQKQLQISTVCKHFSRIPRGEAGHPGDSLN